MLTLPFQGTLNATAPGFTLNGTGQGQLLTGTALNLQGAAQMGPGGLSLQGSQQANVGQFGSGSFQGTANLPLGLTANVQANGSFVNGLQSSGSGALSVGPNGVNGTLQSNTILGKQAQGQVSASIPLGGGYQVDTTLSGQALAGVRAGTGNASLFAPGNGPGQGSQAGTLQLNGTTANVDLGASSFAGLEAQVTSDTALQTPYGTARSVTNLRAADGVGGSSALKFVSNPNEITIGAGGAFEAGPSVGLRQDQILQLKDGSSLQTTGIVSAGGTSAEGQFLFSRNNTDRTTQLGALLAVPIPETPLTAGGGINLKVTDSTLQDGARLLGGPILGETYAQAVTPTMDTLPVVGNALYQSNPIVLAAQHPEAFTAAATLPTAAVGIALDNAPRAAQTVLDASTVLPAAAVGVAVQNAPGAAQVALNVAVAPAAMVADGIQNVQTAGKVAYSAYQLLKPSWMP